MPFITLDDLEQREPVPGFKGRMVHTDNMTLAYTVNQITHGTTKHQTKSYLPQPVTYKGESMMKKEIIEQKSRHTNYCDYGQDERLTLK